MVTYGICNGWETKRRLSVGVDYRDMAVMTWPREMMIRVDNGLKGR